MLFLKSECYGGVDWHDSKTVCNYLSTKEDMSVDKKDVLSLICKDIIRDFPYLSRVQVMEVLSSHSKRTFQGMEKNEHGVYVPCEVCRCDNGEVYYETDITIDATGHIENCSFERKDDIIVEFSTWFGQYTSKTWYYLKDYKEEDVRYICGENFYAYSKGVDLIERFYHEPFVSAREARNYLKTMKKHEYDFCSSDVRVFPFNMAEVDVEWFKKNMAIIKLMNDYGIDEFDETFAAPVYSHFQNICELLVTKGVNIKTYVEYTLCNDETTYKTELFDNCKGFDYYWRWQDFEEYLKNKGIEDKIKNRVVRIVLDDKIVA